MTATGDGTNIGASSNKRHGKVHQAIEATSFALGITHRKDLRANSDDDDEDVNPKDIVIRPEPLMQQRASPRDAEAGLQLISLCREGDLNAVMQQVRAGAPAGFITESSWTPVAAAAYSGVEDVLLYLLDIGADAMYETSARNSKKQEPNETVTIRCNTPLHWACYKGHADTVAILLAAGYNPEAADTIGNRSLHLACSGDHLEVVKQLLTHSAAAEPRNKFGNRPVDLATEPGCRRLVTRFQAQTACEWCKETFSRLRRPSLCQQCLNVFCDTTPCSSIFTPSTHLRLASNEANNAELDLSFVKRTRVRTVRFCQECTMEMNKAERDLRTVLDSKLELIRQAIVVLDPTDQSVGHLPITFADMLNEHVKGIVKDEQGSGDAEGEAGGQSEDISTVGVGPSDTLNLHQENEGDVHNGFKAAPSSIESPSNNDGIDAEQRSSRSLSSHKRRSLPSVEIILSALTLTQTDAESLYTALEAAQRKAADEELLRVSQQTYQELVAHVALQDEVKAVLAVRPIGVRSLLEPLRRALQHATHEHVHSVMLSMALQVIQSAEAECTLFGCHALCERIEQGSRRHRKNIARLEASLAEAQQRGGSDKLLTVASALRDRLLAEVQLEASLLPFRATEADLPRLQSPLNSGKYVFSDGTALDTLLQALEYRTQLVSIAIDVGSSVEGVSLSLLEDASNLLKQLKREVRDESKAEDERRKAEEEAALKAAKKSKKKKKK